MRARLGAKYQPQQAEKLYGIRRIPEAGFAKLLRLVPLSGTQLRSDVSLLQICIVSATAPR